jgi:multidrug efflux pump
LTWTALGPTAKVLVTAQWVWILRAAVYGKETSKYREGEEQYPIQLRYVKEQRENIDRLINTTLLTAT